MMRVIPGLRRAVAIIVLSLMGVALPPSAAQAQGPDAYWPTAPWRTSRPEEQGLNRKILKKLVRRIRRNEIRNLDGLLIVRNGHLVTEEYFHGYGPDQPHTLQSDTKSVTSLLVGAAIQQGLIRGVDQKALDFFPEYPRIRNLDARKAALTLQDLLTMRTGLDWSEARYEGSPLQQLNDCRCDWLRFVLDWPMREPPGTRFEYNSGGVILLAGVIRNASGMNTDAFAQQFLFGPLGIQDARWAYGEPDNLPHTGGGLFLRPVDMARLGYLVLRNGRWEDRQIVSEEWLRDSLRHHVRRPRTFGSKWVDYGYLWWLLPLDGAGSTEGPEADIYTASGAGSQWIFVIPKYDMVVVVTGSTGSYTDFVNPVEFLYTDILRAVQ